MLTAIEPQPPEVALIRAAQSGDRVAFGRIYEQFESLIHGILIAHVPYDDAEDLMHDVFVKAMQQLDGLREPAAFPNWLIMIARRIAADHHRSSRATTEVKALTGGHSTHQTESLALLETIQRLPETYRETLILRFVEGMTGPEIARRTGLKPDSVRVNLCRGVKLLRAHLQGQRKDTR